MKTARTIVTALAAPKAWPAVQGLPRHRLFVVATPPDSPLLLTRIHLNGCVQTRVSRDWHRRATAAEIEALAATHFKTVIAGLAGWPAVFGVLHAISWAGAAWFAASALQTVVAAARSVAEGATLGWYLLPADLWLPLVPFGVGTGMRLGLRSWIRWKLGRSMPWTVGWWQAATGKRP